MSTPIRDVVRSYGRAGLVDIAAGPLDMAAALGRCVAGRDGVWMEAVERKLALSSWDRTWTDMHREVQSALGAVTRGRAVATGTTGRAIARGSRAAAGSAQTIAPLTAQGAGASHV